MSNRYFRRGTTKMFFVASLAAASAPTVSELNAATELSCQLETIAGFAFKNSPINVPDFCSVFVKNIPGEDKADASSMTFYELYDSAGHGTNSIKTLLAKNVSGFILLFPYGVSGANSKAAAGDVCEVWPVTVASSTRQWSSGNDAAKYMVEFTITDTPSQEATVH